MPFAWTACSVGCVCVSSDVVHLSVNFYAAVALVQDMLVNFGRKQNDFVHERPASRFIKLHQAEQMVFSCCRQQSFKQRSCASSNKSRKWPSESV